jgi:hypothetical protein
MRGVRWFHFVWRFPRISVRNYFVNVSACVCVRARSQLSDLADWRHAWYEFRPTIILVMSPFIPSAANSEMTDGGSDTRETERWCAATYIFQEYRPVVGRIIFLRI